MIRIIVPCSSDVRIKDLYKSLKKDGLKEVHKEIKITICLNNPTEKVKQIVENFDNLICETFSTKKRGSSVAKNEAIKSSIKNTDYFNFLDTDCVVKKGYSQNLIKATKEKNCPLIFRGLVEFIPSKSLLSELNCYLRTISYKNNPKSFLSPNITVSRKVFEKVGLFNKEMRFGEDLEFGQRISEFGFKVEKRGSIKIIHKDDESFLKTIKTMLGYGRDRAFRIWRRVKLKQIKLRLFDQILGFQPYWESIDPLKILFGLFYIFISRTSCLFALFLLFKKGDEFFLEVEMINGTKRIIKKLPFERDLP